MGRIRHCPIMGRLGASDKRRWPRDSDDRTGADVLVRNCLLDAPRGIVIHDGLCTLELARRGCGLAYVPDPLVEDEVAAGTLVTTLDAFMPTSPGFFLYFPSGSQLQAKLRAFIAVITEYLQSRRHSRPA